MHSSSVFTYESGLLLRNEGIVSINIRELSSSENPLLLYWDAKVKIYTFNVMHVCKCKASHLQKIITTTGCNWLSASAQIYRIECLFLAKVNLLPKWKMKTFWMLAGFCYLIRPIILLQRCLHEMKFLILISEPKINLFTQWQNQPVILQYILWSKKKISNL